MKLLLTLVIAILVLAILLALSWNDVIQMTHWLTRCTFDYDERDATQPDYEI